MSRLFLPLAALSAFLGVGMGAFGAHGLRSVLSAEMLDVFKTGVNYQMWHALGLGLIGLAQRQTPFSKLLKWAGWLMFTGIILFSGSLYALAIMDIPSLGTLTPFGGMAFLVAWLLFGVFAVKNTEGNATKPIGRYGR